MSGNTINETLTGFARAQTALLRTEFLAPVVRGRGVSVSIGGVRRTFLVLPAEFQGWGVFRPLSNSVALLVRAASGTERQNYFALSGALSLNPVVLPGGASIGVLLCGIPQGDGL